MQTTNTWNRRVLGRIYSLGFEFKTNSYDSKFFFSF